MALGASPGNISGMVVKRGALLLLIGVARWDWLAAF